MQRLLIVAITFALQACAVMLNGQVSQFHELAPGPRSFYVAPTDGQADSLEFRSYAALVRQQLIAKGWRDTTLDTANVVVVLQYQISQGRLVSFTYPVLGQVPTGNTITTGTVNTFGNTATFNSVTTQQTMLGVVGTGVGSRVDFDRAVRVTMYAADIYRSSGKLERVYEGEIRSTGTTGDLPTIMPTLVRGLFEQFPGTSGGTRTVHLLIQ